MYRASLPLASIVMQNSHSSGHPSSGPATSAGSSKGFGGGNWTQASRSTSSVIGLGGFGFGHQRPQALTLRARSGTIFKIIF